MEIEIIYLDFSVKVLMPYFHYAIVVFVNYFKYCLCFHIAL